MGNAKKTITIEDVHQLVDAKNKDPKIDPENIYRQVDRVRGDFSKEMWKLLWMPLVLSILSIAGMLFFTEDGDSLKWHRLSIIVFIFATIWGIYLLRKFDKAWWWIPILSVVVLYLIFSDTLSTKDLINCVTSLL